VGERRTTMMMAFFVFFFRPLNTDVVTDNDDAKHLYRAVSPARAAHPTYILTKTNTHGPTLDGRDQNLSCLAVQQIVVAKIQTTVSY